MAWWHISTIPVPGKGGQMWTKADGVVQWLAIRASRQDIKQKIEEDTRTPSVDLWSQDGQTVMRIPTHLHTPTDTHKNILPKYCAIEECSNLLNYSSNEYTIGFHFPSIENNTTLTFWI